MSSMNDASSFCEAPSMPLAKRAKLADSDTPSTRSLDTPPLSLDDFPDEIIDRIFCAGRDILGAGDTGLSIRLTCARFCALYDHSRPCMWDRCLVVGPKLLPCTMGKIAMGPGGRASKTRDHLDMVAKLMLMVGTIVFPAVELSKEYWRTEWAIQKGFADSLRHIHGLCLYFPEGYDLISIMRPLRSFFAARGRLCDGTIKLELHFPRSMVTPWGSSYRDLIPLLAPCVRELVVYDPPSLGRGVAIDFPRLESATIQAGHDCIVYPSANSKPCDLTLKAPNSAWRQWASGIPMTRLSLRVDDREREDTHNILNQLSFGNVRAPKILHLDLTGVYGSTHSWWSFWRSPIDGIDFDTLEIDMEEFLLRPGNAEIRLPGKTLILHAFGPANVVHILRTSTTREWPEPHLTPCLWEGLVEVKEVIIEVEYLKCPFPEKDLRDIQAMEAVISRAAFIQAHPSRPVPVMRLVCKRDPEVAETLNNVLFGENRAL